MAHHSSFMIHDSTRKGIAALPLVLMISGLIAEVTVALLVGNFLATQSEYGLRLNSRAFAAAASGIQDATRRLIKDKTFSGSYALALADSTADISVCVNSIAPLCVGLGKAQITSLGKAGTRNRSLTAVLSVDSTTGEVKIESITEVALGATLASAGAHSLTGWAYSETVGWISFSCSNTNICATSNYGVSIDGVSGGMSGYAWSENIGWISFNSADLVGCPSGACSAVVPGGLAGSYPKTIVGWAKVLSSGGFMRLSGTAQDNSSYGAKLTGNPTLTGWSWSDTDLGWMHWSDLFYGVRIN